MTKVSSRDVLAILRDFSVADFNNVPKNVENIQYLHPRNYNTVVSFRFLKDQFFILFDDDINDKAIDVENEIKISTGEITGNVLTNPKDSNKTFAMPFRGKACYLFQVVSVRNRLDSEVTKKYPEHSRSTWQKYIKQGYVQVNGQVISSPKFDVSSTDEIAVSIPEPADHNEKDFPIIYMDDNVIVVNKPSGVLTHSKGVLDDEFTVSDFFRRYSSYNTNTNRCGIVHRLDRDTSGVIIGARNDETAQLLQKQFADRKTKKIYMAVVVGKPKLDHATIDVPIGRNPVAPSTFRADANGKSAQTMYEVVKTNNNYSLVKLQPKTGRTHQIRVHMKYINCPIAGDRVYGKSSDRLYLHAFSLELTIPNGNRRTFVSDMPKGFDNLVE